MNLTKLREIAKARTPGQWNAINEDVRAMYQHYHHRMALGSTKQNAEFIAAMSRHIDALLDVVEAAKHVLPVLLEGSGLFAAEPLAEALKKLEEVE